MLSLIAVVDSSRCSAAGAYLYHFLRRSLIFKVYQSVNVFMKRTLAFAVWEREKVAMLTKALSFQF